MKKKKGDECDGCKVRNKPALSSDVRARGFFFFYFLFLPAIFSLLWQSNCAAFVLLLAMVEVWYGRVLLRSRECDSWRNSTTQPIGTKSHRSRVRGNLIVIALLIVPAPARHIISCCQLFGTNKKCPTTLWSIAVYSLVYSGVLFGL